MRPSIVHKMLFLSESDVQRCLSMSDCLQINRQALRAVANGHAVVPTRLGIPYQAKASLVASSATPTAENADDWTLFKPAAYLNHQHETALMGLKVVSIRADNPSQGLPLVPATILSLSAATGMVQAVLAGTYLTGARTAAGSALSVGLVRPDLQRLVVFGAGLQAKLHIQAISTVLGRPIPSTTIINRTRARAEALQAELPMERTKECNVVESSDVVGVADALAAADVISTCTNASRPIFDGSFVRSGCHITGIGSYTPDMQEVPARMVDRCRVLIDTEEARSVGDLQSLAGGHPVRLLGDVLDDPSWLQEPQPMLDCTFYKAVGTAIQDVMTADRVVQKARELGIGTEIDMS